MALTAYRLDDARLLPGARPDAAIWIDLHEPDPAERAAAEAALGLSLPSRAEMEEIEVSSRLYFEDGAAVMTAMLPEGSDDDRPLMAPVTFVLTADRLATLRPHTPRSFVEFPARAAQNDAHLSTADSVLMALLETVVDRLADILERISRDIDALSHKVFGEESDDRQPDTRAFQRLLRAIGRKGDLVSELREALVTLDRLSGFLAAALAGRKTGKEMKARLRTLSRDIRSLSDHAGFHANKVTFLLDATLGMISIQQNATMKIFSVVAVAFTPPTLIASVFGMNFERMPELSAPYGYYWALGAMLLSATLPLWLFRRMGWL